MAESKLTSALIAALKDPSAAAASIRSVSREAIKTAAEAELVVRLLKLFPLPPSASAQPTAGSSLHTVVGWMQGAKDKQAIAVLREHGAPELLRIFDEMMPVALPGVNSSAQKDLLFLLKIVCIYAPSGGLDRVVTAARSPLLNDGYLWSAIFGCVSKNGHPWQKDLVQALRHPLPDGFTAIAFLDLCNAVARSGALPHHPFDTEPGLALLQSWLLDKDNSGHGHSAAASIPFLSPAAREKVQPLADQHPDRGVQLEAAWAAAACNDPQGYLRLQAACAVPQEAAAATAYLKELGADDRIPPHSLTDDFKAISQMCQWLAHPMEFGSPPAEIHQVDARELFWPPTNDRRKLWVFRYRYPPREGATEPEIGHGMVGSVTFALFGEATPDLSAEQVYGLHCAWELEVKRDPRAPSKRTVEAGIEILRQHNPGFAMPA
jgi:hypothetical protein